MAGSNNRPVTSASKVAHRGEIALIRKVMPIQGFQLQPQNSHFLQDPDKMPLEEGRFIPQKIHLSITQEPDAHIRAKHPRKNAAVLIQVSAGLGRSSARLSGWKAVIQGQQPQEVRPIVEYLEAMTARIFT
jgi:hypothetical protein